jgi:hypothetical protein
MANYLAVHQHLPYERIEHTTLQVDHSARQRLITIAVTKNRRSHASARSRRASYRRIKL